MPKNPNIRKVLVIGSGPIVIGQAAEFDYAGTQACRVLKEEGVEVVLVNCNPATIMTDTSIADKVYHGAADGRVSLEKIIAREHPDSLLASLGGQTGLNLAMELDEKGILQKYNVQLLGTKIDSIRRAEDREDFKNMMLAIGEPCIDSVIVRDVQASVDFANEYGYPVIVRPAYTLGGTGGGIAEDRKAAPRNLRGRPALLPRAREPDRAQRRGLEGNRIRGHPRQRGQLHHRLQHGKLRPGRRAHRRFHRRRAEPDPARHGAPDAAQRVDEHHQRAGHRGRLQRAVCAQPGQHAVLRHRGQPARVALLRAGLQGDGLPDCQGDDPHRAGLHAR